MTIIFTLCSNNYLAQARILAASVRQHQPSWTFIIGLVDKKDAGIPYDSFGYEVIEMSGVEPGIDALAGKYNIIELNTCLKPTFFQYLFGPRNAEQVIYLDPDTRLYGPLEEVEKLLADQDIILTPHILSPIAQDGLFPDEPLFLNYGLYNLGFLALRRTGQTLRFLQWWKDRTYLKGYDLPAKGLFTDQLWINLAPLYFDKVWILRHPGYNMGPWNLHERSLKGRDGQFFLESGEPLAFYHFSNFKPAVPRLHGDYTRHTMAQRPDLRGLYDDYREEMRREGYHQYSVMPCHYVAVHKEFLLRQQALLAEKEAGAGRALPFYKKMIRGLKAMLPLRLKRLAHALIKI